MFQRLLIHVINQLKTTHSKWYLYPLSERCVFRRVHTRTRIRMYIHVDSPACILRQMFAFQLRPQLCASPIMYHSNIIVHVHDPSLKSQKTCFLSYYLIRPVFDDDETVTKLDISQACVALKSSFLSLCFSSYFVQLNLLSSSTVSIYPCHSHACTHVRMHARTLVCMCVIFF